MNKRHWRDRLAAARKGLCTGAIPGSAADAFVLDGLEARAGAEASDELFDALLDAAVKEGRVPVAGEAGKRRAGRPAKGDADIKMLREIRAQQPGSDGEGEFKTRLTQNLDLKKRVSKDAARRRYRTAADELEKEKSVGNVGK
jgi:hypothetical protein